MYLNIVHIERPHFKHKNLNMIILILRALTSRNVDIISIFTTLYKY